MGFFNSRHIFLGNYFEYHTRFQIPADVINDEVKLELEFCESVLDTIPEDIDTLKVIGHRYTEAGEYEKGLIADLKLSKLQPQDPLVWYNLACSYSLLQKEEEAVRALQAAVDRGYDDLLHMESDKDLNNIRDEEAFKKIIQNLYFRKYGKS
jgi:tetratricopeptide (TPR) repeat protein